MVGVIKPLEISPLVLKLIPCGLILLPLYLSPNLRSQSIATPTSLSRVQVNVGL